MKHSIKLAATAAGIGLAALISAGPANATGPEDYFHVLEDQDFEIWDRARMLQQGYSVCNDLANNVNPYPLMIAPNGAYDPASARSIIAAARIGLCPGVKLR